MITQSNDTNPKVERVFISLLRKLNTTQKLEQIQWFSNSIIRLSKRAISRANPDLSEDGKKILFVEYHYGKEIAERLRSYLNEN